MLCLSEKCGAGIKHADVRKTLIDAAQDDFRVFPAQTHQTLAHRTTLYGNFWKKFEKKQHSLRQRRRRPQMHQGLAHEPRFGDDRTARLIYNYIIVHVAVLLHYYGAFWSRLVLSMPVNRGLQPQPWWHIYCYLSLCKWQACRPLGVYEPEPACVRFSAHQPEICRTVTHSRRSVSAVAYRRRHRPTIWVSGQS